MKIDKRDLVLLLLSVGLTILTFILGILMKIIKVYWLHN